jgi:hypothetical protein
MKNNEFVKPFPDKHASLNFKNCALNIEHFHDASVN